MAQLTNELSCLHYDIPRQKDEALRAGRQALSNPRWWQIRVFLALFGPPTAENRI